MKQNRCRHCALPHVAGLGMCIKCCLFCHLDKVGSWYTVASRRNSNRASARPSPGGGQCKWNHLLWWLVAETWNLVSLEEENFQFNLLWPRDALRLHECFSILDQVMACWLFSAKSLVEPMLTYCHLKPYEQSSVKLELMYKLVFRHQCVKSLTVSVKPYIYWWLSGRLQQLQCVSNGVTAFLL